MIALIMLPLITDGDTALDAVLAEIAAAGATSASVMALHLRPGAREWFWRYLEAEYPHLVEAYAELYRGSAYVVRSYAGDLAQRAKVLLHRHGLTGRQVLRQPEARPPRQPGRVTTVPTLF